MKQKRLLFLLVLLITAATGAWAQTGMTNGSFSVSATKRVYFSKGNLQLVGENTFQFAENQWDYFGNNQSDNHRDLFCWGTGNNPNQTTGISTFTDWGDNTYLQATLGKGWRTLTKDEFAYVFNTRASGSSVFGTANGRYTTATINTGGTGVKGIILFPDGITIAADEVTTAGTINNKGTVTQCTTAQWAALAEKGCVFLPAGGFFLSGGAYGYGDITDYWSSTAADANKAYNLGLNFGVPGAVVNTAGTLGYNYGCSVRLVIDEYVLTLADGTKDADKWTATVGTNSNANPLPVGGLSEKDAVTLTYGGRLKVKNVTATTDAAPAEESVTLATPLTIEAVTPGTIQVYMTGTLSSGMKYSVNGGTKTTITESTDITVAKDDKVQFYGNGTSTQAYGDWPVVSIQGSGDGFQTKVYGNIMSLVDETGFATKTDLPEANYVFYGLFAGNTTLIDASELLLPAVTLTNGCYQQMFESCNNLTKAPKLPATTLAPYCYNAMFFNCTSLTTAPKLPATTLAMQCYYGMFIGCKSLTSAYVKAAYTGGNGECTDMFVDCKATGAVLHTTPDSKASWEDKMGSGKEWENWSVADDWQD